MHHSESSDATSAEKGDIAQAWYRHDNIGIDQNLNCTNSAELYTRYMGPRRKARRKDDGPLAMLCEWVVEHQIGESL